MFRSSKKEHFIDLAKSSVLLASVDFSEAVPKLLFVKEYFNGQAEVRKAVKEYFSSKTGYAPVNCIIHPRSTFIRKFSLEVPARARDREYLIGVLKNEYLIEPEEYNLKILNATNGMLFDPEVGLEKELVFCGAKQEEIEDLQDQLIKLGVYPRAIEIGRIGIIGGLLNYTVSKQEPTLLLNINKDASLVTVIFRNHLDLIRPVSFGINSMIPAMQEELALEDEKAAYDLLFSNTFDFRSQAPVLLQKLIKELQMSIDYYEVQTGQSVGSLCIMDLPEELDWVRQEFVAALNLEVFSVDYRNWLSMNEVEIHESVDIDQAGPRWMALLSSIVSKGMHHMGGVS